MNLIRTMLIKNKYPRDLRLTIEKHPVIDGGCCFFKENIYYGLYNKYNRDMEKFIRDIHVTKYNKKFYDKVIEQLNLYLYEWKKLEMKQKLRDIEKDFK
jgi:hypothetical protein